ncbi:MAG: family 20 glycosylhydrolase [Colwellia sp.]
MPCPEQIIKMEGSFVLKKTPVVYVSGMSEMRKSTAIIHLKKQIKNITGSYFNGIELTHNANLADIIVKVSSIEQKSETMLLPQLGDNEAYQLNIDNKGISIKAESDFGALHGLTTLVQLIALSDSPLDGVKNTVQQKFLPFVMITDKPRFKWRGLLIDSVRHFIPIEDLKRQLRGMAAAKLNVFHWHLTDDQGWRVESKAFPKLHQLASDGLFYTQKEIIELVNYASQLGIRVVPELDLPGHASAIAVAYPELMAEKKHYKIERNWGVFEPLLDVSNPEVYEFVDSLVGEFATLFPDEYLHIGGDEVNPKQWQNNRNIQTLMTKHSMKDAYDVHNYFNAKLEDILTKHKRKMMGWDEILHEDLSKNIVVQSWRGQQSLNTIAGSGYQALLSAGFYIDQPQATSFHYRNDPLQNLAKNAEQAKAERKIVKQHDENWHTWSFIMPRLKGSAVKGSLTVISNSKKGQLSAYLKLNEHYHQKVLMHTTLEGSVNNQLSFLVDSWMGPLRFQLTADTKQPLNGFTMVGNSYYAIEGKEPSYQAVSNIELQPLLAPEQSVKVLGGEATLWSEMVDENNIDLRTWPRLFAIAERLWSPQTLINANYMYERLMKINHYASEVIGLEHIKQQRKGFLELLSSSPQTKDNLESLLTLAQFLEPAHYYTRHHIKYQQNKYHQNAPLDTFVDYLPVESYSLILMEKHLQRYQKGDNSALLAIQKQFILSHYSSAYVAQFIDKEARLSSLKNTVNSLNLLHSLATPLINRCLSEEYYSVEEAKTLEKQLRDLQAKTEEIVVAVIPFTLNLLKKCQTL